MPFDGILSPATEALISGRRQIEAGWCQGVARRQGKVCAVAALTGAPLAAFSFFSQAIGPTPTTLIGDWNDAPGRTKEDVLAAFDRAIALSFK